MYSRLISTSAFAVGHSWKATICGCKNSSSMRSQNHFSTGVKPAGAVAAFASPQRFHVNAHVACNSFPCTVCSARSAKSGTGTGGPSPIGTAASISSTLRLAADDSRSSPRTTTRSTSRTPCRSASTRKCCKHACNRLRNARVKPGVRGSAISTPDLDTAIAMRCTMAPKTKQPLSAFSPSSGYPSCITTSTERPA